MDLIIIVVKKKGKFELLLVGRYVYTQLMFFLLPFVEYNITSAFIF